LVGLLQWECELRMQGYTCFMFKNQQPRVAFPALKTISSFLLKTEFPSKYKIVHSVRSYFVNKWLIFTELCHQTPRFSTGNDKLFTELSGYIEFMHV